MMKKVLIIFVVLTLLATAVLAQDSTFVKLSSKINPKYLIEEIKEKPYIIYFYVGKLYFNSGDLDKSKEMFERAISFKDDFSPAYHNIGVVHYERKEYELAIEQFNLAIDKDPTNTKAYYSLGILFFELTDFDNAIVAFKNAVILEPDNPNMNFDLAQSYVAKFRRLEENNIYNYEDLENALTYLKSTEELQPGFPNTANNIDVIQNIIDARQILTE